MTTLDLKIVPDDQPNAPGEWVRQEVPHGSDPYDHVPKPGYHVVRYQSPRSLRDGGPMYSTGFYPPGC